jgi:hypothetical protein
VSDEGQQPPPQEQPQQQQQEQQQPEDLSEPLSPFDVAATGIISEPPVELLVLKNPHLNNNNHQSYYNYRSTFIRRAAKLRKNSDSLQQRRANPANSIYQHFYHWQLLKIGMCLSGVWPACSLQSQLMRPFFGISS